MLFLLSAFFDFLVSSSIILFVVSSFLLVFEIWVFFWNLLPFFGFSDSRVWGYRGLVLRL